MATLKPKTSALKAKLFEKIEAFRPRTQKLVKEHGKVVIDKVTIDQCIGGARDVRCLVTDISYLDPQEGIRFRGKTIPETFAALPRKAGIEQPTVESFFYFLLTRRTPVCAFCPPGAPNEAIEVQSQRLVRPTSGPITVTGKFSLQSNGQAGLFYQLSQAEVSGG